MANWSAGQLPAPLNSAPGFKGLEQAVNTAVHYDAETGEVGVVNPTYPVGNVKRYGATGADDGRDATDAFLAAADTGGRVHIPRGFFKVSDEIPLTPGTLVSGEGSADAFYGAPPATSYVPSFVYQATAGKAIFTTSGGASNVRLQDVALSPARIPSSTPALDGKTAIAMRGSYPDFAFNLSLSRVTLYNFEHGVTCIDPYAGTFTPPHDLDWNCAPVGLTDCRFYYPQTGVYLDTNNADLWTMQRCPFFIPPGGTGVYLWNFGFVHFSDINGGGSTRDTNALIRIRGHGGSSVDRVVLDGCQGETLQWFLKLDAEGTYGTLPLNIHLRNCLAELGADVLLENQCRFITENCRWQSTITVASPSVTLVTPTADQWGDQHGTTTTYAFTNGADPSTSFEQFVPHGLYPPVGYAQDEYRHGMLVRSGVTAAPTTGTYKVGDRAVRVPVVGQPKAWVCTVAGTPGTWVSEGLL